MQLLLAGMEWISSTSPLGSPDGTELILEPSIMKCIYIYITNYYVFSTCQNMLEY